MSWADAGPLTIGGLVTLGFSLIASGFAALKPTRQRKDSVKCVHLL